MGNPISPSGGGLIEWVESIWEDLTPLLAKADLPSDLDALAAKKLARKSPVVQPAPHRPGAGSSPAQHRPVTGSSPAELWRKTGEKPARYRLAHTVTSDNSPADAAHEAGMAVRFLVGLLQ
ncbi:MAG: hypothetical protein EBY32_20065, partial [Proteobacteria bacterium]|nr:hypothetical protein [Pseudomonadota bacterium]